MRFDLDARREAETEHGRIANMNLTEGMRRESALDSATPIEKDLAPEAL
jgi:hypothetical protein